MVTGSLGSYPIRSATSSTQLSMHLTNDLRWVPTTNMCHSRQEYGINLLDKVTSTSNSRALLTALNVKVRKKTFWWKTTNKLRGQKVENITYREQIILVIFRKYNIKKIDKQLADFGEGQGRLWNDTWIQAMIFGCEAGTKLTTTEKKVGSGHGSTRL